PARNLAAEGRLVTNIVGLIIGRRGERQHHRAGGEVDELVPHPGTDIEAEIRPLQPQRMAPAAVIDDDIAAARQRQQQKLELAMTMPATRVSGGHTVDIEDAANLEADLVTDLEKVHRATWIAGTAYRHEMAVAHIDGGWNGGHANWLADACSNI